MLARILTALVLLPPVLYLIGWSPRWLFVLAVLVVAERSLYEYFLISCNNGGRVFPAIGYAACALVCVAQVADLQGSRNWTLGLLTLLMLVVLSAALFQIKEMREYLRAVSTTVLGVLYTGLTFSCLIPIGFSSRFSVVASGEGRPPAGRQLLLLLFVVIWIGDIFAYFGGRALGRTKLFPRVSPNKTVEGSVAGLVGSVVAGWAFIHWMWETSNPKAVMLLAGLTAVAGQVGDLVESAMKRGADIKDSGTLLPGHGGMLDRIDGVLFGAPVLWLALSVWAWTK